jgi:hypothetical protein
MTTITPIRRIVNSSGLKATTGIIFYEGFIRADFLMMNSSLLGLKIILNQLVISLSKLRTLLKQ